MKRRYNRYNYTKIFPNRHDLIAPVNSGFLDLPHLKFFADDYADAIEHFVDHIHPIAAQLQFILKRGKR